ncbi:uncharacterized protein BDZ99DRAFT_526174 [Mytilinidion resinicola]|uniref:BTB domain-containing protein n=1 Tax=Mytilinidion resinicola TaxID=574789 RepID=A0A6A6Y4C3_9PEZI|nr:uncharacterized protein BDZ99DRAFT_526174 [Mytilinidion resinicola]KAF2803691.1 hypothetical protein BDZ99DRAFT_526174 [Mytilinidion resinicola]
MANLDFLARFPAGNASLSVVASDGVMTIHNLHPGTIGRRCPLLELSFEQGASGIPRASVEATSVDLVVHFLRFCYTGDYLSYDDMGALPFSLLMHAQLCRMAEIFEVPELQALAHTNVIRETELACSLPSPPLDLCPAIRFIYEHLADQRPLVETILHYCVYCFLQHRLGTDDSFRQVAFELRPFHQDLCRTSFQRGFQDDGAIDIVRLPVQESTPHSMQELGKLALGDFLYGLWSGDVSDLPKELGEQDHGAVLPESEHTLVYRPKVVDSKRIGTSEDDVYGYTLVHLPKYASESGPSNLMSNAQSQDPSSDLPHAQRPSISVQTDADTENRENLEDWTITSPTTNNTSDSDSEWAFV